MSTTGNSDRIRELNDRFRSNFDLSLGSIMLTAGVNGLAAPQKMAVLSAVRKFSTFDADKDPNGEHDFGSFEHEGDRFFWKIDYYDRQLEFGSDDPSDPTKTKRVLTIMFAHEY